MMTEIESLKSQLKEENKRHEQDLEQLRQSVEQWAKDKMPTVQAIKTYMETLQSQLLSALAAIEEAPHDNDCWIGNIGRFKLDCKCWKSKVNRSLLHEHDAEVRKPLVDLILELRNDLAAPKSPLWDKFNDALAKQ